MWHVYATLQPCHMSTSCPGDVYLCQSRPDPVELQDDSAIFQDRENGDNTGRLFPGGGQYGRFMDCLRRIVNNNPEVFINLGISPEKFEFAFCEKGGMQPC